MRTLRTLSLLALPLLLAALPVLTTACATDEDTGGESAFGPEDNDDTVGVTDGGKADSVSKGYGSGCGTPVRTGKYALRGDVVTPQGVVTNGYVVVDGEKIAEVRTAAQGAPAGVTVTDTNGIIFPGLLDGHGHVEYNHIPIADLGKRYTNRDQWPNAKLYKTLVKDPKNAVTAAGLQCEALKHGEVRALVGGTTAIQGTPQTACVRPLVRNLEQTNFCQDRVRQNVLGAADFDRGVSGKPSFVDSIKDDVSANKLDAFVVHIAEGIDDHALAEWQMIKDYGLNIPQLVIIHAAAFGPKEFQELAASGGKMVWSPLSNLLLYGKTADVPSALDAGVLVSLGSDWAPSGSANLLGELKVADRVNQVLWHGRITDQQLVDMVTVNPAQTFGLASKLGTIEAGKYADFLIIAKPTRAGVTAQRALIEARPQDVLLVTVSGDALFGVPAMMDNLGKKGDYEVIDACGSPRGIDVTVTAKDVTKGTEKLADVESKLVAVNPRLTPVIDCTDASMRKAFLGTPMQY